MLCETTCKRAHGQALSAVRSFVAKMSERPLDVKVAARHLEQFRTTVGRFSVQQPAGFRWKDAMSNEGLRALLEEWKLHVNARLAARARDTLEMVEVRCRQEDSSVRIAQVTGLHRNAGQAGYRSVMLQKAVIHSLQQHFKANDERGVETMMLLYGGELSGSELTVTDLVQVEHVSTVTCPEGRIART